MYAIVDIETTGGNHLNGRITEIAVYHYSEKENIRLAFQSLINPQCPIPPFVQNLTGITDEMVKNAPLFTEIAERLYETLNNKTFVAHNVGFDYNFIKTAFRKNTGILFETPRVCTIKLSRQIFPNCTSYSLGKLCQEIGIELEDRHRAAGDALATAKLFDLLMSTDKSTVLSSIKK